MKKFKIAVFVIILALLVLFSFQNIEYFKKTDIFELNLSFLGTYKTPELSNAEICIGIVILTIIIFYLLTLSGRIKQRKSMKELNSTLNDRDNEINSLRSELKVSKTSPSLDVTPTENVEILSEEKKTVESAS